MTLSQVVCGWMSDGFVAWVGFALTALTGSLYLAAARRRSSRGRRWPVRRSLMFIAGLVVVIVALDSTISAHDEIPSVHMVQHVLLMMLAPLLLTLGSPVTLILRSLRPRARHRMLTFLRSAALRRMCSTPLAIADYNVPMAVVLVRPIERFSAGCEPVHIGIHVWLLVCGLMFWERMLGRDPVPGRLSARCRVAAILGCIPVALLLAGALVAQPGWFTNGSRQQACAVAGVLACGTLLTSLAGAASARRRRRRHSTRASSEVSARADGPATRFAA